MARNTLSEFEKRIRKEISQNLKTHTRGITQAELSSMTGIPSSTLSGYFAERSTINAGNVQKIADALGLDKRDIDPRFEEASSVIELISTDDTEINNVIKKRRDELNLTQEKLAEMCGVSIATIKKWETGNLEKMKRDKISLLSRILKISPLELLGLDDFNITSNFQKQTNTKDSTIIVYGKVCAGDGLEAFEDPLDEIANPYLHLNGEFFALQVQGDSMNNIVNDGLYAIIKKQPIVNNGEIAVVLIDNQIGMLKRFYQLDDMVILRPDSTNPKHQALTFVGDQINDIKVLGKFIGFVSPIMD